MKVLKEGHLYELANFEEVNAPGQTLQFIEKEQNGLEGPLETVNDGTTNEEVLKVLIDRLQNLGKKLPSRENSVATTKCQEALMWLEERTRGRMARGVEGTSEA